MAKPPQIASRINDRMTPPRVLISGVFTPIAATASITITAHLISSVGSFICTPYPHDTHTIIGDLPELVNTPRLCTEIKFEDNLRLHRN